MNKKVVVTGGAGFIGSAIIKHLNNEGHEIFVIDNLSFGNRDFIDVDDDHFFNADILDRDKMESIITDVDPNWVIHLAAIHFIPYCNKHPFEATNINVQGTINVYDACKKLPNLERLFFASTAAVYPISDGAVSEEHRLCPLDVYGLSKLTGERLSREFHLETGVPTVICRFFNAFGPNETNPHLIPEIQQQINSGKRTIQLGNLEPKRDFIHTYDMARAVISLLSSDVQYDVFNLGRGIEYSVKEIVESFERELGEAITIEQNPDRMRKTDRMHLLANVDKLKSAIGWEPEWNIDQGVKTLIDK
jgi:UDP-glucose 4-epimerase